MAITAWTPLTARPSVPAKTPNPVKVVQSGAPIKTTGQLYP